MNKYLFFTGVILTLCGNISCNNSKTNTVPASTSSALNTKKTDTATAQNSNLATFVPKGYVIFEKVYGDLNKDGQEDCVLIVKGTNQNNIVKDESRGTLDKNRRGLIVLFNKNGAYELALKNYYCFSSENEDGGVYYAPELSVEIDKGNLYIRYAHGRYGFWGYTFRFQNSGFELIGYDASEDRGPIVEYETSINYLTRKKIVKANTNESAEGGDEVFKRTESKIDIPKLIQLSEIKDFDELEVPGK